MTRTIEAYEARSPIRLRLVRPTISEPSSRLELPPYAGIVTTAMVLASTIVLCVRNSWVFSIPVREDGDMAANSILVNQAVHFQLLVGNYSREGFNHPGPAYLYIQSFGQDVFYSWLHIVPTWYNGQLLAVFLLNSVVLTLVAAIVARHTRSWVAGILAVAVVLLMTGATLNWASSWMPYFYAAPFLLATVAGVSVASGALRDLPAFAFAVGLLVHGNVSFIPIMTVYVLVVGIMWLIFHGPGDNRLAELRAVPGHLKASGAIVGLFALPMVLELLLHWPGQFGLYLDYVRSNSHAHPHSLGSAVSFVVGLWPGGHAGVVIVLLAAAAAAVLAAFDPVRRRTFFVVGVIAAFLVLTLEFALYAEHGVDFLSYTYTGYFYYVLPPLMVALLVAEAWGLAATMMRRWAKVHGLRFRSRVRPILALLTATFSFAVLIPRASMYFTYRGDAALSPAAAAVKASPLRQGRGVAIALGAVGFSAASDWPAVTGLLVAASRDGYQPCVANPAWRFMMTSQYICTAPQAENRWTIAVDQSDAPVPPGSLLVFHDNSLEVFQPPVS